MGRFARKVDSNHPDIVQALTRVGAAVLSLAALPGALDLLVGFRGVLYLLEVKDGAKPKNKQALTSNERTTIELFQSRGCPVFVVRNVDEALAAIGAVERVAA